MKQEYVIYKGVRMTEQEAEERINAAYCDAADKAQGRLEKKRAELTGTAKKPTAARQK